MTAAIRENATAAQLNANTIVSVPPAGSDAGAGGAAVRMAEEGPVASWPEGWLSLTVAWGGNFCVGDTWMRAVSFFGAAFIVTGAASA